MLFFSNISIHIFLICNFQPPLGNEDDVDGSEEVGTADVVLVVEPSIEEIFTADEVECDDGWCDLKDLMWTA